MPDYTSGQGLRFRVRIDHGTYDLGAWSKCDGLSVEYEIKEYQEGGENGFVHKLPGRVKYQNLKLTRILSKDSENVAAWVSELKKDVKRHTAEVAALDSAGQTIAAWNFEGVYPLKWTGPSFDIGSPAPATETLELVHNGFQFKKD